MEVWGLYCVVLLQYLSWFGGISDAEVVMVASLRNDGSALMEVTIGLFSLVLVSMVFPRFGSL
jgi:hypothetical protein